MVCVDSVATILYRGGGGGGFGEECACTTVLNSCIYLYKVSFYSNTKGAELHLTVMSPNMLIDDDEVRDQKDHSMI